MCCNPACKLIESLRLEEKTEGFTDIGLLKGCLVGTFQILAQASLESWDWIMIAVYFGILLGIAWWVIRKNKDTADEEEEWISQTTLGFHPLIKEPGNKQHGLCCAKKTPQEIAGCKVSGDVLLWRCHGACLTIVKL